MADDGTRDGVKLSNLDQQLFDDAGVTKRELVDYLDAVAGRMVPVLAGRALSVVRVRLGQKPFMQKNLSAHAPAWISTVTIPARTTNRDVRYALCDDRRTLLWLANQRAVEYHPQLFRGVEWNSPTHLVLDLDPPEGAGFPVVVAAAHLIHRVLDDLGMSGAVKTSGAKGVHVFVPLDPTGGIAVEDVAAATRALAARAERLDPATATTAFIRDDRGGKVFLDSTRAGGATVVAAYSPRARPGVPVSFPIAWDDLDSIVPQDFTVRTALERLGGGDPWQELMPAPQPLDADLVAEGHTIPVARVQAMHEGKRRKRARESLPEPKAASAVASQRLDVDGEVFDVVERPGVPGQYDFTWVSGRNPGYGFSSRTSDGSRSSTDQLEAGIRSFLAQIDPGTGYID